MLTDLQIAQVATLRPILELAADLGLEKDDIEPYGWFKAKVHLEAEHRFVDRPAARYVDVTAITPTPLGEGKTTTTVGLSQALGSELGKRVFTCIRQPSMGPTFGIKGGAAGGGYAQVVPMEDFNLHLTGDNHAVAIANNLAAAAIDARMIHERHLSDKSLAKAGLQRLNIDSMAILWRRVMDVEDASLRHIVTGLGGPREGTPRETAFDIAVASEVMAILALATDLTDLRARLGRMVLALNTRGQPITAEDFGVAGAMAVLLKDAIMPNLLQTLENTPAFVHAGPFANIAHGNSSIIADRLASRMADYVVTESGFGADCGMEKFFDIKCRVSGLNPNCVVMVATVRALKMHGGLGPVVPGKPLPRELVEENLDALRLGCENLIANINIAKQYGVPVVVAVNRFATDTEAEIDLIRKIALQAGAFDAVPSNHWAEGGRGARQLAKAVVAACEQPGDFRYLYPLDLPIKDKIEIIATRVYGAGSVEYSAEADRKIKQYEKLGYGELPICMAKTQLSLSHDPALKGAPKGYVLPVSDVSVSAGAGFVYPLCGDMKTMPGLSRRPSFMDIDLTADGKVTGLF